MKNRRAFLLALGMGALMPLESLAPPAHRMWRIGFISGATRPPSLETSFFGGFLQQLRELGYVEGRAFAIEWRFAEAKAERYAQFAAELARLKVDVFVLGTPQAARAVQVAAPR